ncbi:hypothetical protein NP233_g11296 [Leucocoprinus birnbaumii]|uniref:Uncharacterized protein n=1 Tax=Leucocoprinus birnbaumii TaxID=56174 RepID=A0AAD5VIS4_9AGAR|nr:hypothetical protein NP233_g11296 [Leucocoprinus birnbaumii]
MPEHISQASASQRYEKLSNFSLLLVAEVPSFLFQGITSLQSTTKGAHQLHLPPVEVPQAHHLSSNTYVTSEHTSPSASTGEPGVPSPGVQKQGPGRPRKVKDPNAQLKRPVGRPRGSCNKVKAATVSSAREVADPDSQPVGHSQKEPRPLRVTVRQNTGTFVIASFNVCYHGVVYVVSTGVGHPPQGSGSQWIHARRPRTCKNTSCYSADMDSGDFSWIGLRNSQVLLEKSRPVDDDVLHTVVELTLGAHMQPVLLSKNLKIKDQSIGVASNVEGFEGVDDVLGISPNGSIVVENMLEQHLVSVATMGTCFEPKKVKNCSSIT